jgi:hypothetical protein
MTALAHVWVRGTKLELVRADQIISLAIEDPRATGGGAAMLTVIPETRKSQAADKVVFSLTATVAGREESVHLRNYKAQDAVEAIQGLAGALAKTAGRSEPVLYVYPWAGDGADWEIQASLPVDWIA